MITLKDKAIKVLSNDCKIRHKYFCNGKTCAIGALALAAGCTKDELLRVNTDRITSSRTTFLWRLIECKFGFSEAQLALIQTANDSEKKAIKRRKTVVELVKSFNNP